MFNVNCCCGNESINGLIRFLLIFSAVNAVLSFVAIFIRAASTERYDIALIYLEAMNNGTFSNVTYDDCKKSGYIIKDTIYCNINGEYLKRPSDGVNYQKLFKNWESAELAISIIRTVIAIIFLSFSYYVIKNKGRNILNMDNEQKKEYISYLYYLLYFTVFMLTYSGLCIIIRMLALTANMDIGLYVDTEQNEFEGNIAINYIIDIIEIVLYSIEICFIVRLKRSIENPPSPSPPPQPKEQTIEQSNQNVNRKNIIGFGQSQQIQIQQPTTQRVTYTSVEVIRAKQVNVEISHSMDNLN